MGRLIGTRPDDTERIAKRVGPYLEPGERVLAGVHLQSPGTNEVAMANAASGAVSATVDLPPSLDDGDPKKQQAWRNETAEVGIDEATADRSSFVYLVLTSSRLLLVRRSRLLRWRSRELLASWPLEEIDRVEVPRGGSRITVHHATGSLTFELPQAHKFLPQVYRDLPAIHKRAAGIA